MEDCEKKEGPADSTSLDREIKKCLLKQKKLLKAILKNSKPLISGFSTTIIQKVGNNPEGGNFQASQILSIIGPSGEKQQIANPDPKNLLTKAVCRYIDCQQKVRELRMLHLEIFALTTKYLESCTTFDPGLELSENQADPTMKRS